MATFGAPAYHVGGEGAHRELVGDGGLRLRVAADGGYARAVEAETRGVPRPFVAVIGPFVQKKRPSGKLSRRSFSLSDIFSNFAVLCVRIARRWQQTIGTNN